MKNNIIILFISVTIRNIKLLDNNIENMSERPKKKLYMYYTRFHYLSFTRSSYRVWKYVYFNNG